ncbi:hypothetical protein L596_020357 [Steinernema carpocapsae]|uniref:Uncharacterized protein n=1 Tax=Steinernema carpocapsae TaxID=34508 RepID=A0A4U5MU27_STECR|nr:hypothetical protein L596_020357 [Steinernema carpocapsae]
MMSAGNGGCFSGKYLDRDQRNSVQKNSSEGRKLHGGKEIKRTGQLDLNQVEEAFKRELRCALKRESLNLE